MNLHVVVLDSLHTQSPNSSMVGAHAGLIEVIKYPLRHHILDRVEKSHVWTALEKDRQDKRVVAAFHIFQCRSLACSVL